MKKNVIQLNQDPGGSAGNGNADQIKDLKSVIEGDDDGEQKKDTDDADDDDKGDQNTNLGQDANNDDPEKKDADKGASSNKKFVVVDEDDDDEEGDDDDDAEKKNDDKSDADKNKSTDAAADDEGDDLEIKTWQDLGKVNGLEVEVDNFKSYTTAVKTKIDSLESKIKELSENPIKALDDQSLAVTFGPEGAFVAKYLMKGGTIQNLLNPVSGKEAEMEMSDEDLMLHHLKSNGYTEVGAKKEIEFLKETERLEYNVAAIRSRIEKEHTQIIQDSFQKIVDGVAAEKQNLIHLSQREDSELVESIEKTDKFLDLEIDKEAKDKIIQKIKTGFYRKRLKNVQNMAQMILAYEFSKNAVQNVEKATAKKVASSKTKEFTDKVFNVPQSGSSGSGRSKKEKSTDMAPELVPFTSFNKNEPVVLSS